MVAPMGVLPQSPLRVLFLTVSYPTPEAPVAGTFVREHALAAAGRCDVAVVHLERAEGVRGLVEIHRVDGEEPPLWRARYRQRPRLLSALGLVVAGLLAYRRVRREFVPDVVHAHFFLAGIPALLLRKPLVVTEHWSVFLPEDPAQLGPVLRAAARAVFRRAALVLPASRALERAILELEPRTRSRAVPNAVDISLFRPRRRRADGGPHRLLSVGLLYDAKAYDILLDAVAALDRRRSDFQLSIVGDGPLRAELEAQAERLDIRGVVTFEGLKPKTTVAELMSAADLFVLASRFDNNPCVLIEAAASGLPIVATEVGGIPDIVDRGGILVPAEDPERLARAIGEALDHLHAFEPDRIAATARARFSREAVGAALREAYEEAVGWRESSQDASTILGRR